jgi:carbonic anhydrase/acetyltransferase-like protein (isoleucine patch superfamily)
MPIYELDGVAPELPPEGQFWLAPDAVLIGRVRLEADASIWWGSLLRGDNELIHIGAGSNVQDLSVMHTDMGFPLTIGENCTIGHRVTLHGCTVGDNTLVGIGATILNGTRIGNNCIIGAHTLLAEGKDIPDNSLVMGAPGRIVRQTTSDDVASIAASAAHYRANWRRYARGLAQRT